MTQATTPLSTYYQRIIQLVLDSHAKEFSEAGPGHCMKITGFGETELGYLWFLIRENHPGLDTFIVSESLVGERYISATKLIELRNQQARPLLVLIPANSRTAAEDSYGNATFKEIHIQGLDAALHRQLLETLPPEFQKEIREILQFLQLGKAQSKVISYLLKLSDDGYTKANVGNFLYLLGLIPDAQLLADLEQLKYRLNSNRESIKILGSFDRPLNDRVSELSLVPQTIQKKLIQFLKEEVNARSEERIAELIYSKYSHLNFASWPIPNLDFEHIKLAVDAIKAKELTIENGRNVLEGTIGKVTKLKVRFRTAPAPKNIAELKFFRVKLIAVNGGAGDEICVLKKAKNTTSNQAYREVTVELNSNLVDEGSYFLRVQAEDEHGTILNDDDDFKDQNIQEAWRAAHKQDEAIGKADFDFKRTSDSDDFHFVLVEGPADTGENDRKDKLNNVLQAYFRCRIGQLKRREESSDPHPMESSNMWLNDKKRKLVSTFHINYGVNQNFQINLSTKLRQIEELQLENKAGFGFLDVTLAKSSTEPTFQSVKFLGSEISSIVPNAILKLRQIIFTRIEESNGNNDGVFETANVQSFIAEIKDYVSRLADWTGELRERIEKEDLGDAERSNVQHLLTELQMLDMVRVRSTLPNGRQFEALLMSPLHPLRLAWTAQLWEVFHDWESKTIQHHDYLADWSKDLESLFVGTLFPENNPLILVKPGTYKSYHYAGELTHGWGLYLAPSQTIEDTNFTSVNRQLTHFLRLHLNISKEDFLDADISQKLIVRHFRNYISQHPYADKLIINLFNAGDANVFADALVELESDPAFHSIQYEIRVFKGEERIIEHGEALRYLINPEYNVSEAAEAFSQPAKNRLFPKLRFSVNEIKNFIRRPGQFPAHISFLISPFPVTDELVKLVEKRTNFYLNGLITDPTVAIDDGPTGIKWSKYIVPNVLLRSYEGSGESGIRLFDNWQTFTAGAMATSFSTSTPATRLMLSDRDKVLLTHLHDYSDWVVTFDRHLGPQLFDQPAQKGKIPFLLDYVPGETVSGISSFLTTRPTSEILGLLGPHFGEFDLDIHKPDDEEKIKTILEDLRAISSSLVLQLNSSKNKAFEVIGSAFTKRILEKKGYLTEAFLVPVDLHQNLFENLATGSRSRADNLLVAIDSSRRTIKIIVLEIKCRKSLSAAQKEDLREKMKEQIVNTIEAIRFHFDPSYRSAYDRLDREVKNKELRSLLSFYIERAARYGYLSEENHVGYIDFLQTLEAGFSLEFNQIGMVFDFSAMAKHEKEVVDSELTFFTFGGRLIGEILDPTSDLNTKRLEDDAFDREFEKTLGLRSEFDGLLGRFTSQSPPDVKNPCIAEEGVGLDDQYGNADVNHKESQDSSNPTLNDDQEDENLMAEDETAPFGDELGHVSPSYDIMVGKNTSSLQFGLLGKSTQGKKIAIDLSETNTISLFGVQGGGKSYTIGTVCEMVLRPFSMVNQLPSPMASVIFHYSESQDYAPEFTSMINPNNSAQDIKKLEMEYGAAPSGVRNVVILTPKDKVAKRQAENPSISVYPISFNSSELNVSDWLFLLGAVGNDSTYIKQLKAIMKENRNQLSIAAIAQSVEDSDLLSNSQKSLARQRLSFARDYVDDGFRLSDILQPGRLVIVDLRDEFIEKDEALGLFVIMLNIFSAISSYHGQHFNKFIVFDEAHKYMGDKDLTGNIVTAIREMRHKGVSIMIASQDPPSLPNEIITLSSIVMLHRFNSPQWLKHIQKSITQIGSLTPMEMSSLSTGEAYLWAKDATEKSVTNRPIKISTRPRVTKHGGGTIQATGKEE